MNTHEKTINNVHDHAINFPIWKVIWKTVRNKMSVESICEWLSWLPQPNDTMIARRTCQEEKNAVGTDLHIDKKRTRLQDKIKRPETLRLVDSSICLHFNLGALSDFFKLSFFTLSKATNHRFVWIQKYSLFKNKYPERISIHYYSHCCCWKREIWGLEWEGARVCKKTKYYFHIADLGKRS